MTPLNVNKKFHFRSCYMIHNQQLLSTNTYFVLTYVSLGGFNYVYSGLIIFGID